MILVPADRRGFSYTPVHTVAGVGTSATYYEDVRVPARNLVGELNGGWSLMTNQLNHERVALTSAAPLTYSLDAGPRLGAGDQEPRRPAGDRLRVGADRARPGARPGRGAHADQLEARRRRRRRRDLSPAEASATKIYGSELATEVYRSLMEIVGPNAGITGGLRRRRARRPARALLPLRAGDDLRRRHQRDPARHHRVRRPRPAPRRSARAGTDMDFRLHTRSRTRPPSWPPGSSSDAHDQRAAQDRRGRPATASTATCGPSSATPRAARPRRCPRSTTAPGSACVERCRVLVEVGRTVAPVPLAPRRHGRAARSPSSAPTRSSSSGCRRRRSAASTS